MIYVTVYSALGSCAEEEDERLADLQQLKALLAVMPVTSYHSGPPRCGGGTTEK